MTLTLGWWVIPATTSIAAFWWAATRPWKGAYDIGPLFHFGAALIVTLAVWLVYFITLVVLI